MTSHRIGTREEWLTASAGLLEREKELTRMGDELARQRRELPWVPVDKEYTLQTADGAKTLAELFDGRSQLIVYHFMFGPGYEAGCPTCSSTADSFNGVLDHLRARDVTMICVSRAPVGKLLAYRERMGWTFTWASSYDSDFNVDYGVSAGTTHDPAARRPEANEVALLKLLNEQPAVRENLPLIATQNARSTGTDVDGYFSEGHGVSTFALDGGTVYHCYSSYARGTEFLMGYYAILDRAPKGRDEGDQAMSWLRRHDEYEPRLRARPRSPVTTAGLHAPWRATSRRLRCIAMTEIVLRVRLIGGEHLDVTFEERGTADKVVDYVISTLAEDNGVLRCRHGDRLIVLYGRGIATLEVAPRGAVV